MIRIAIDLDFQSRLDEDAHSIVYGIEWEFDGFVYPFKGWSDFGEILGFWASAVERLHEGSDEEDFVFMDGPYEIFVSYDREKDIVTLSPRGEQRIFTISLAELTQIIIQACQEVKEGLEERKVRKKDQQMLEAHILYLQQFLLKSSYKNSD